MRPALKVFLPVIALLAVCIGWSIFWRFAADATEAGLDDWFAQERLAGRIWICTDRSVSGYPFRIEVRCLKPTFSGPVANVQVDGSVGDIVAVAHVYQPTLIVADIAPPLRLQSKPDRGSVEMNWRGLRVSYRSSDGALQLGSLSLNGGSFVAQLLGLDEIRGASDLFELHVRQTASVPNSLDIAVTTNGLTVPLIDGFTGDADPVNLILTATVSRVDAITRASNVAPLERWRRAGGLARITQFNLAKGAAETTATGQLDLDASHRIHGRLDISALGLGPILEKLGIPAAALAIGNLLSGSAQPPLPSGATRLSVSLDNGRISVGPVGLPMVLQPVY